MQTSQVQIGDRFGRLVVTEDAGFKTSPSGVRRRAYRCKCDCGNEVVETGTLLKSGCVKSCGCHRRDRMKKLNYKHGDFGTRLYMAWVDMRRRCSKSECDPYGAYKSRGIRVCREWQHSWLKFKKWALSHGYRDDLTLDRIDNDKGYCPSNCRWATIEQQANNKQGTVWVETPDGRMSLMMAVRKYGKVCYGTAHARIYRQKVNPWLAVITPTTNNEQRQRNKKKWL